MQTNFDATPMRTAAFAEDISGREWLAAVLFLGLAALAAVVPLLVAGPSCGHDFTFHLQSWIDAAAQLRRGTPLPRWAFTPAWNAGEPRFLFYPPLSWLIGALLQLALPIGYVPVVFVWFALTASGLGLYRFARDFAPRAPSLLAATLYLAGPYALFTAFERSAFGELLAAAWMPLLLRAAVKVGNPSAESTPQRKQKIPLATTAVPLALLWLTNAPAAVMGTYAFTLIVLCRFAAQLLPLRRPELRSTSKAYWPAFQLLLRAAVPAALGFALAAFYLIPAAYERRWVEISMAILPNMRIEDNFLFAQTGDGPHDAVVHTASLLALTLLAATAIALALLWRKRVASRHEQRTRHLLPPFTLLLLTIGVLLTSPSRLLWDHLPELAFLQFPWRLLAVLSVVLAATLAVLLTRLRLEVPIAVLIGLVLAGGTGLFANHAFRQGCEIEDLPARRVALFKTGHGFAPTDEYTPSPADNDLLRPDNPPFWPAAEPGAFAPGTTPNPSALTGDYDTPLPVELTLSGRAPGHLNLHLSAPGFLVLNLRAYPAWQVLRNGVPTETVSRKDGLLAIRLPSGDSAIDIHWRRTPDVLLGDTVSVLALLVLLANAGLSAIRSRKLHT